MTEHTQHDSSPEDSEDERKLLDAEKSVSAEHSDPKNHRNFPFPTIEREHDKVKREPVSDPIATKDEGISIGEPAENKKLP